MHYFDYAASTPMTNEAVRVFSTLSQNCFGNTSSLHDIGGEAQNILAFSRQRLANLLGTSPNGIFFTSGGTESNVLSIISLAKANAHKGKHIIASAGEHPSVDSALDYLRAEGFEITSISFDANGGTDLCLFNEAVREDTILATVQHINPEIGTIQPIGKIADLLQEKGILLHCDGVQSFGKIDVSSVIQRVDAYTMSSHKVYGPKGTGAVYIHPKHRLHPVFPGFVHEDGFRGGTINVPGIAAFVTAAEETVQTEQKKAAYYYELRQAFMQRLSRHSDLFTFYETKQPGQQLPQIIGMGINQTEGQLVMLELNRAGFAISTGSACKVGQQHASKTMTAMQIDVAKAKEFIRISFGKETDMESVCLLADQLIETAQKLHKKEIVY